MLRASLLRAFAAALLVALPAAAQDLESSLAALQAPSAAERFAAERWLAAHLAATEPTALVAELVDLDAGAGLGQEATWRLGRALGSRPGNLGLALQLLTGALEPARTVQLEIEPALDPTRLDKPEGWGLGRRLGRLALDQEVATWRTGLDRPPLSGAVLQLTLREERERHGWQPLEIKDGLVADVIGRIAREGDLPVPIVLAQGLAEKLASERFGGARTVRLNPFRGSWDRVLFDFARAHGLAWEAVLYQGEAADEIAWLRLVPRGEEGVESGTAQLVRALEDLARRSGDKVAAESSNQASVSAAELQLAARFLACVEWDAASAWLGALWLNERDGMARSALLEAAGRGRIEPQLATRSGVQRLLAFSRSLDSVGPFADPHQARLGDALANFPSVGSDGSRLAEALATGWQTDDLAVRQLRLRGLAGMGATSEDSLALARAVLANTEGQRVGEAALAALAVLAQAEPGAEAPVLGSPDKLLALVPDAVAPDELARRLSLAGVALPAASKSAALLSAAELRLRLMAHIYAGEFDLAGRLLIAPSSAGGLGLGEPGSWARSCERGHQRRVFKELTDGMKALLRGGELMAVRSVLDSAGRLAAQANAAAADPNDLTALSSSAGLAALPRIELLAGAMDPAHQAALLEQLASQGDGSPIAGDPAALGRLAAAPVPGADVARQRLLLQFAAALTSPRPEDGAGVLPAIEDCLAAFWARSADGDAEAFVLDVATVAAGESSHPLAQEVLFRSWPPSPK